MNHCCQCKMFFTSVQCNRDHFPADEACERFKPVEYKSRKRDEFARLADRLAALPDEELIAETLEHCRNFMFNTAAGQYLFELCKRIERRSNDAEIVR